MSAVRAVAVAPVPQRSRPVAPARRGPVAPARRGPGAHRATRRETARPTLAVLEAPTAGWARRLAAVGAVVFAALVLAVAIQGERIRTQERYDAVRAELLRSDERNRDLRVAVAQAESPEVVLDAARDLGMVEPGPIVAVPAAPVGDPVDTDVP